MELRVGSLEEDWELSFHDVGLNVFRCVVS